MGRDLEPASDEVLCAVDQISKKLLSANSDPLS